MISIRDIPTYVRAVLVPRLSKWLGRDAGLDEQIPLRLLIALCAEPVSASAVIIANPQGGQILAEAQHRLEVVLGRETAYEAIKEAFESTTSTSIYNNTLLDAMDAAVVSIFGPDKKVREP